MSDVHNQRNWTAREHINAAKDAMTTWAETRQSGVAVVYTITPLPLTEAMAHAQIAQAMAVTTMLELSAPVEDR